jgi:hypothetical protein
MNHRSVVGTYDGKFAMDRGDRTIIVRAKFEKKTDLTKVSVTESRQANRQIK